MVDKHFRWDFIGLSTDTKPTPATSSKVVDGSTYYTSDDSKLYVWYKDQWYEKEATGGGIPTDVVDSFWFGTQAEYELIETKNEKTLYLIQETTSLNSLSLNLTKSKNISDEELGKDAEEYLEERK